MAIRTRRTGNADALSARYLSSRTRMHPTHEFTGDSGFIAGVLWNDGLYGFLTE